MKSLNEFNAERWEDHKRIQEINKPHPNGIACPKCGEELWDSNPMVILTSNPPRKNVYCPNCGYKSYRLA